MAGGEEHQEDMKGRGTKIMQNTAEARREHKGKTRWSWAGQGNNIGNDWRRGAKTEKTTMEDMQGSGMKIRLSR